MIDLPDDRWMIGEILHPVGSQRRGPLAQPPLFI